jgi:hypothetical protein
MWRGARGRAGWGRHFSVGAFVFNALAYKTALRERGLTHP